MSKVEVRTNYTRWDVTYEIEGALEDVQASIDGGLRVFHPNGYSTRFDDPVEISPGVWLARGKRDRSSD